MTWPRRRQQLKTLSPLRPAQLDLLGGHAVAVRASPNRPNSVPVTSRGKEPVTWATLVALRLAEALNNVVRHAQVSYAPGFLPQGHRRADVDDGVGLTRPMLGGQPAIQRRLYGMIERTSWPAGACTSARGRVGFAPRGAVG
jgi:hypothetical protein